MANTPSTRTFHQLFGRGLVAPGALRLLFGWDLGVAMREYSGARRR
jgi:hypothetical protein